MSILTSYIGRILVILSTLLICIGTTSCNTAMQSESNIPVDAEYQKNEQSSNLVEIVDGVVSETWGRKLSTEPVKIKIFARQDSNSIVDPKAPFWKEMEKMTGVTIVNTANKALDQVSDLSIHAYDGLNSDIVSVSNLAEKMDYIAAEGKFLDLHDYLDYMPNLRRFIETDFGKQVHEMSLSENGEFYLVPAVEAFAYTHVPMIRKDWLDELGLPIPQTTDELYKTLTAFRDNELGDGLTVPFVAKDWVLKQNAPVLWGARTETRATGRMVNHSDGYFYHGWSTKEFRHALTEMSKWYDEGLIAANVFSVDKPLEDHFPTNHGGFTYWSKSKLVYNQREDMPEGFNLVAMLPTEFNGQRLDQRATHIIRKGRVGISASSKNPQIAAMFLDALLSPEGSLGQSVGFIGTDLKYYKTTEEGLEIYRYTETYEKEYLNNDKYSSKKQMKIDYGAIDIGLTFEAYLDQIGAIHSYETEYFRWPSQVDVLYREAGEKGILTFIPAKTMTFSKESIEEIEEIKAVLEAYQNIEFQKAIMGDYKKLDDEWWSSYIEECNRLGMERLVEIYNK